MVTRESL
jgi:hypothetical protein